MRPCHGGLALATVAAFVLVLAGAAPAGAARVTSSERLIRQCANRERAVSGLPALRASRSLGRAARAHARRMARRGFFAHVDDRGWSPLRRVRARSRSWTLVGENIAMDYPVVAGACRGWLASPEHLANIHDPRFTAIGAGFARARGRSYFVQVFATGA